MSDYLAQFPNLAPDPEPGMEKGNRMGIRWLISCTFFGLTCSGAVIGIMLCFSVVVWAGLSDTASKANPTPFFRQIRPPPLEMVSMPKVTPQLPASPSPTSTPTSPPIPSPTLPPATKEPPSTPELRIIPPGKRSESYGIALTVNNVIFEETEGLKCIAIDLTLENLERELFFYSPFDFRVIRENNTLEQAADCGANNQALQAGELGPGSQAQGYLFFQQVISPQTENSFEPSFLIYQQPRPAGEGAQLIVVGLEVSW